MKTNINRAEGGLFKIELQLIETKRARARSDSAIHPRWEGLCQPMSLQPSVKPDSGADWVFIVNIPRMGHPRDRPQLLILDKLQILVPTTSGETQTG